MMLGSSHDSPAHAASSGAPPKFCPVKSAEFIALARESDIQKAGMLVLDPTIDVNFCERGAKVQGKGALWYWLNNLYTLKTPSNGDINRVAINKVLDLIKAVIRRGGNIHQLVQAEDARGMTPFLFATTRGLWDELSDLKPLLAPTLNAKTVNIVTKVGDHAGVSPLMSATVDLCYCATQEEKLRADPRNPAYRINKIRFQVCERIVTWFLESGANVNALSLSANRQGTPLTAAIDFQKIDLARKFLLSPSARHNIHLHALFQGEDTGKSAFWHATQFYMMLTEKFRTLSVGKSHSREWQKVREQKEECRSLILEFLKFEIRPYERTILKEDCAFTFLLKTMDHELINEVFKKFKPCPAMLAQASAPNPAKTRYFICFLINFVASAIAKQEPPIIEFASNLVIALAELGLDIWACASDDGALADMPLVYFCTAMDTLPQLALNLLSLPIKDVSPMQVTPTQGEFKGKTMLWWAIRHLSDQSEIAVTLRGAESKKGIERTQKMDALWRQVIERLLPFFLQSPNDLLKALRDAKLKNQQAVVEMVSPHLHPEYLNQLTLFPPIPILRVAPQSFGKVLGLISRAEAKAEVEVEPAVAKAQGTLIPVVDSKINAPAPIPSAPEISKPPTPLRTDLAAEDRKRRKKEAAAVRKAKRDQAEKSRMEEMQRRQQREAETEAAAKAAEAAAKAIEAAAIAAKAEVLALKAQQELEAQKEREAKEIEQREKAILIEREQAAAREAQEAQRKIDNAAKAHLLRYGKMLKNYLVQAKPFLREKPRPHTAAGRSRNSCKQFVTYLHKFSQALEQAFPDIFRTLSATQSEQESTAEEFYYVKDLLKSWNDQNDALYFELSNSSLKDHPYVKHILNKLPIYFIDAGPYYKEEAMMIFLKSLFPNNRIWLYGTRVAKKLKRTAGAPKEPPCRDYDCAIIFEEKEQEALAKQFTLVKSKLSPLDIAPITEERTQQQLVRDEYLTYQALVSIPVPNKGHHEFDLDLKVMDNFPIKGFGNNYGSVFLEDTGAVYVHHNGRESAYRQICAGEIVSDKPIQGIQPAEFVSLVAFHTRVHAHFFQDNFKELHQFYLQTPHTPELHQQLTKVLGKLLNNKGLFIHGFLQISLLSNLRLWCVPLEMRGQVSYLVPSKNYFNKIARRWNRTVEELISPHCTQAELLVSVVFFPIYLNIFARDALISHLSFLMPHAWQRIFCLLSYFEARVAGRPAIGQETDFERIFKHFSLLNSATTQACYAHSIIIQSHDGARASEAGLFSHTERAVTAIPKETPPATKLGLQP